MRPKAVLFDVYGTLLDVHSVSQLAEQLFPGQGERLSLLWRDKQIEYTRLVTMSVPDGARYRPFWDLTRAGLRFAAERLGLALDERVEQQLLDQYRRLAPFPDSRDVLQSLQQRQIRAGVLSNGDPEMLATAVANAGLAQWLDPLLSVHAVRRFKTDPAAYALGPAALGMPAREILFVSSNGWDAIAATWFGYTTLWVNRTGAPPEQLDTRPTRIGTSLRDVLAFFD